MMMRCDEIIGLAGEYLERRLGWRRRVEYVLHLMMCKGCRTYVEQFRIALAALRSLPEPASGPVPDALAEAFRRRGKPGDGG